MASLEKDKSGNLTIRVLGADGKRRPIRLGKVPLKLAASIKSHVAELESHRAAGVPLPVQLAKWTAAIDDDLHTKLVVVGLVAPREAKRQAILADFIAAHLAKRASAKHSTLLVYKRAEKLLLAHFGAGCNLGDVTEQDAIDFSEALRSQGKAEATIRRMCSVARMLFKAAVRGRLLTHNPFDVEVVKTTVRGNADRFQFIPAEWIQRIVNTCPDDEWRALVILSRFGGLRCPSEHLSLKWGHVNWEQGTMAVPSPKTAHHEGKGIRVVPLFPEVREILQRLFDVAPEGSEFIITRYRRTNSNLRTQFERIITLAGLNPWPRLFHNLRASRQTELSAIHPEHVVCGWLGNSQAVAREHYLHSVEADLAKAISGPAVVSAPKLGHKAGHAQAIRTLPELAATCPENDKTPQNKLFCGVMMLTDEAGKLRKMDDTGLEPVTSTMSTWRSNQLS